MYFKNFAFAKLNVDFGNQQDTFIDEYDRYIAPKGVTICNSCDGLTATKKLNSIWQMAPDSAYDEVDCWQQPGNFNTYKTITKNRRAWKMASLVELDAKGITDPLLLTMGKYAGPSLRNEGFDLTFNVKEEFKDLAIVKWIKDTLPFEKIIWMHCVHLDPGGMATIHRDMKGLYDGKSSAGVNKVFSKGFITLNINISNGGVPLYWALDGKELVNYKLADDPVYITNDYFYHGVPVVTSRRRQIRISGIPGAGMIDLLDRNSVIELPEDYEFDPSIPTEGIHY
jgi:hypothetical protein